MPLKVIGVGDQVVDKYMNTGMMYPGGNALNFAVYAKLLGQDSAFLGIFGRDRNGIFVSDVLGGLRVDQSRSRMIPGENGYACVELVDGDRKFLRSNCGGIAREKPLVLNPSDLSYLRGFDLIHTSINSHIEPQMEALHATGVPVSFDFSDRGDDGYFKKICPFVEFSILSCGHLSLAETLACVQRVKGYGSSKVIATRGKDGAIYDDGKDQVRFVPTYVDAKDTLGAGDAFLTAFLLEYLKGKSLEKRTAEQKRESIRLAMQTASEFAAKICMVDGAFGHGTAI